MKKSRIVLITTLAIVTALCFSAFKGDNHNFQLSKQLNIFNALIKELDLHYVDTIMPEKAIKEGIDAMLEKLDPYTTYYTEEGSQELKMMITGKYAGIGSLIRFHDKKNTTVIAEPYDNMPAAKAGLQIGDQIQSINSVSQQGLPATQKREGGSVHSCPVSGCPAWFRYPGFQAGTDPTGGILGR